MEVVGLFDPVNGQHYQDTPESDILPGNAS